MHLSIDPGREIGWAIWDAKAWTGSNPPTAFGIATGGKHGTYPQRIHRAVIQLRLQLSNVCVHKMFVEWPKFMESGKGAKCAKDGDLVKLCFSVGVIAALAWEIRAEFVPVEVSHWKGQCSKKVIAQRIRRLLGKKGSAGMKSHIFDAVGIGLWAKGKL